MNFQFITPSGILSKYIKYYWILETNGNEGLVKERVIPTGNIDMIFHYAKTLSVNKADGSLYMQAPMLISGQNNTFVDVSSNEKIGMISVVFYPQTASLFFDFPMNIIENQSVSLNVLLKYQLATLEDKFCYAETTRERISSIEDFLLNCFYANVHKKNKLIEGAIYLINNKRGQITSKELANTLGISNKKLERKFSEHIGKSPKQFTKIVRFQSVLDTAMKFKKESLTSLAYNNGYFDQAHFIHDFKNFTGYTPKDFFKVCDRCSDYFE